MFSLGVGTRGRVGKKGRQNFEGTDDYIRINDAPSISGLSKITMSSWAKWDTVAGWQVIIGKYFDDSALNGEFILQAEAGNKIRVVFQDRTNANFSRIIRQVNFNYTPGIWYHFTASYDGTDGNGIKLHINGGLTATSVISNNVSGPLPDTSEPMYIGARAGGTRDYFGGTLDDLRVYNRALSTTEAGLLYDLEKP